MSAIKTLFANIRHAAYNGDTVEIGGGVFSPAELKEAVDQFNRISDTLVDASVAFSNEEDSVKEEHADVIKRLDVAVKMVED